MTMNNQLLSWQEQIANLSTPTFCILPWIHFTTRPNGDMRLCCVSNASGVHDNNFTAGIVTDTLGNHANFSSTTPLTEWNNTYMKSVRRLMLDSKIPSSCTKCFKEEENGVVSKRVWETMYRRDEIKNLISSTTIDGEIPNKISYIDLRLGNTCNLKCVMCGPVDSSKWISDHSKLIPLVQHNPIIKSQTNWTPTTNNLWYENSNFWEDIRSQIPYLTQLNFAGGEPLLIKEHITFIKELITTGYSHQISLKYNTNGLLINDDILKLWSHFKKVQVGISLDGIGERNWYIRYPCDWNVIEKNLNLLDQTPDNIEVTIACAIQILNIKHIVEFVKWKVSQSYKKINLFTRDDIIIGGGLINFHFVYMPSYLDIRILPQHDKDEIINLFAELKLWLWDNYTTEDWFWHTNPYGWARFEAILSFLTSEDKSNLLPSFKEYISSLDLIRGTSCSQLFPELSHLL